VVEAWIPLHARQCTADDIEFHSLRLLQHLADASCKPVTLWPSHNYGPRWAGRDAWVTTATGRTRQVPANVAKNATPLITLLPRHYHARSLGTIPRDRQSRASSVTGGHASKACGLSCSAR
jgi:hypothetical protein